MVYPEGRSRHIRDVGNPRVDPGVARRPGADFGAFYAFDAHYDSATAAAAERALQLRAILRLRPVLTLLAPSLLAIGWLLANLTAAGEGLTRTVSFAFALALLILLLWYVACVTNAQWRARRYPVRPVSIGLDGISVRSGTRTRHVHWRQIRHVWRCGRYDMLILGRFSAMAIPAADLSPAARNFIIASVGSAI